MYQNFERILMRKGLKPYDVTKATGIASSTLTDWKKGRTTPKLDKLQKIADYLEVSMDELTGQPAPEHEYYLNEEARDLAQFVLDNPEYSVLFDASRKVKPEDIKKALKAIGIFIEEDQ